MRVYGYKTLLQGETEIFAEEIKNKIGPEWAEHFRNKNNRTDIGERLKDPQRWNEIVIVRDMWLTVDAPVSHTLSVEMGWHNLMHTNWWNVYAAIHLLTGN